MSFIAIGNSNRISHLLGFHPKSGSIAETKLSFLHKSKTPKPYQERTRPVYCWTVAIRLMYSWSFKKFIKSQFERCHLKRFHEWSMNKVLHGQECRAGSSQATKYPPGMAVTRGPKQSISGPINRVLPTRFKKAETEKNFILEQRNECSYKKWI